MIPLKDNIPSSTVPVVTITLMAANIIVFIYQLSLGFQGQEAFIFKTAAIPYEVTHLADFSPRSIVPPPFTLFTAMFVHGGLLHLAGNMLFLWIFGDNVEDAFGHLFFVLFYLAAGLAASLTHIMIDPISTVPMIGASGAIAGVLGAYFILYPKAQVNTLVFFFFFANIVRIPAVVFLGIWFLIQVISSGLGGGVAWYAHVGGFVAGAFMVAVLRLARPRKRRL